MNITIHRNPPFWMRRATTGVKLPFGHFCQLLFTKHNIFVIVMSRDKLLFLWVIYATNKQNT
jgi:hypothetical protein